MGLIKRIWNGELPLVKVYWLYGVALGAFFTIFSLLIKNYPIALIVIAIALIPYQILVFVGIWRSADAYKDKKIWAILAKVNVVFSVIAALNGVATVIKNVDLYDLSKTSDTVITKETHKLASLSSTKRHTTSDGKIIKWQNNKECYISWNEKVSVLNAPADSKMMRELEQEEELVAIVYFPATATDGEIDALIDREAFLKIKNICLNN